jgi:hypothetical protein
MNRLALSTGGLAAALALLLGGCSGSGDPKPNGPLGNSVSGPLAAQCFQPTPKGSVATLGMLSFSNKGGPARITRITLVDAHNLQTVAEWVVPITGHNLIGVLYGYPPYGSRRHGGLPPGIQWAARQRAVGATIAHTPFPKAVNLVLVLRATGGTEGTARTVVVDYQSGGSKYQLNFGVAIELFNGNQPKLKCRLTVN